MNHHSNDGCKLFIKIIIILILYYLSTSTYEDIILSIFPIIYIA